MTLREKQSVFILNVAKLILYAYDVLGCELTAGELWRTNEQQQIYLKKGLTKVKRSNHQNRLAVDLNLFKDGLYKTDSASYKDFADYWKRLHPDNVAGYD